MIEAGAQTLAEAATEGWLFTGRYPQYEFKRQQYRDRFAAALTAALGVCEVHEERRQRWPDGYALEFGTVKGSFVGECMTDRRLVITTPAEQVDTEGADRG